MAKFYSDKLRGNYGFLGKSKRGYSSDRITNNYGFLGKKLNSNHIGSDGLTSRQIQAREKLRFGYQNQVTVSSALDAINRLKNPTVRENAYRKLWANTPASDPYRSSIKNLAGYEGIILN